MGKTPSRKNADYWVNGSHDWISIADLGTFDKYVGRTKETISDSAVSESGIKAVPSDTVIMSFKLSLGKVAITTEPSYTNEAIMAFVDKGEYPVWPSYVYHQFKAKDWSEGTNKAVMGKTLNKQSLGQANIKLPNLDVQKNIASNLDYVDDQKRLMEQVKEHLDNLVKSRFIEMFGDIDIHKLRMGSNVKQLKNIAVGKAS